MTEKELAFSIKKRIEALPHKFDTATEQIHYEQGILLGLLASLSYQDSKNYDLIMNRIKKIGVPREI